MKLIATALAGAALIALAGCNRAGTANNSTDNAVANVAENAADPAAPADTGGKPAANEAAVTGDAAAADGGKPAEGEAPAEGAAVNSGEGGK
jgi:hypothetical protein